MLFAKFCGLLERKAVAQFGLRKGQDFTEYDLMYVNNGMLFWGARNVDDRGFEKPENRPTNLQIPMMRKQRQVRAPWRRRFEAAPRRAHQRDKRLARRSVKPTSPQ